MQTDPIAPPVVEADLNCVACGYNLRMQPVDGRCPECGATIRHTITFPHLARSAPRWLVSLLDSVTVMLVAVAIGFAGLLFNDGRDTLLSLSVVTSAWGMAWFAVWLLTRPEPGVRDFDATAWGWTMRVLTTLGYAGAFFALPIHNWFRPYGPLAVLLLIGSLSPATCLYYNHLRRAAERLPSARLAFQATALQLLVLPVLLVPCARLFMGRDPQSMTDLLLRVPLVGVGSVGDAWTFAGIFRARLGLWDWLPLATGVSALVMLWAVALLVQFRIAFAAAVREAGGGEDAVGRNYPLKWARPADGVRVPPLT